jgi:hypothetical protein
MPNIRVNTETHLKADQIKAQLNAKRPAHEGLVTLQIVVHKAIDMMAKKLGVK